MTSPSRDPLQHVLELCGLARDGVLSPEQHADLETLLTGNARAQQLYVEFIQLDTYLALRAEGTTTAPLDLPPLEVTADDASVPLPGIPLVPGTDWGGTPLPPAPFGGATASRSVPQDARSGRPVTLAFARTRDWLRGNFKRRPELAWAAGFCALVAGVAICVPLYLRYSYVATVTSSRQVRDANQRQVPAKGTLLSRGQRIEQTQGTIEIAFDSGATVVLQGSASFSIGDENSIVLDEGRLLARVPPTAVGFRVDTPTCQVTDLGTEFSVEVQQDELVDVVVYDGKVDLHVAEGRPAWDHRIAAGESVHFDPQQPAPQWHGRTEFGRQLPAHEAPLLNWPIRNKTLVAWVYLDNARQQGAGVLSLVMPEHKSRLAEFDAIVFGELAPGRWMAGSHGWRRSRQEPLRGTLETARPEQLVQIAIVYDFEQITIYRNGKLYAQYDAGGAVPFDENSIVVMGKRHPDNPLTDREAGVVKESLHGRIEEARIYNFALAPELIASLTLDSTAPIEPIGRWTFEDGTARDAADNFPPGELHGGATISGGKLILNGRDSYVVVPPARIQSLPSKRNLRTHEPQRGGR